MVRLLVRKICEYKTFEKSVGRRACSDKHEVIEPGGLRNSWEFELVPS